MTRLRSLLPLLAWAVIPSPAAHAQSTATVSPLSYTVNTPRPFDPSTNTTNPSALATQSQNPFLGSVPAQPFSTQPVRLSLQDTVARGLKTNLGLIVSETGHNVSTALRLRALSALLPQVSAGAHEELLKTSFQPIGAQRLNLPDTLGPYTYGSLSMEVEQTVFDLSKLQNLRAARAETRVSEAAVEDARNIVVLASASAYLQMAASASRVQQVQAELETAKTFETLMANRVRREVSPEIDSLRAQVLRQTAEQRLKMAQVRLEKDQLVLTRIIGLAPGQAVTLTDAVRYVAAPEHSLDQMLEESATHRQDLKSAQARLDMAIAEVKAQRAERLPVIAMNAAYGGVGVTMGNLHEIYSVSGTIRMPIFTGRRIESQIAEAQAQMERRRAEYEDLRARVGYDIRTAVLDLDAAQKSVAVATANLDLSRRGWKQASDRFEAGVSPSIELVTAQQAVAEAEDNYVASLYAHGMAKLAVIRAMGTAEHDAITYLEGR